MKCWFCDYKAQQGNLFSHMWSKHHEDMIKRTRAGGTLQAQLADLNKGTPRKGVECFLFRRAEQNNGHTSAFTLVGFSIDW